MYRIYRNLHRRDWTIQHWVPRKGWRKMESRDVVTAPSVEFVVYDSGRRRAQDEGRKNVHAFAVVPYLTRSVVTLPTPDDYAVRYTPFDDHGFRVSHIEWDGHEGREVVDLGGIVRGTQPIFARDGRIYCQMVSNRERKAA